MKANAFFVGRGLFSVILCLLFVSASGFASDFKVGMVLDLGGKDDKSFNTSAVKAMDRVKSQLKASVKYVEPTDENAFEPMLRSFVQRNYDLIIAVGVSQAGTLKRVAARYPNQKFIIIDGEVHAPNVQSILFKEHEGSYLVGAIAALTSKTAKIGFIGGMDIPIIRRFELGYTAGARKINPKINITSNFIGVTAEAWNNPARAKELAVSQYNSGVDIIFGAAGASATGLFDAAEEKGKLAIGVDSNQNYVKPGFVLTSMVKKIEQVVYAAVEECTHGSFKSGTKSLGLANDGVEYSVDQFNEKVLSPEVRKKVETLKKEIISKKITVPDYYEQRKQ